MIVKITLVFMLITIFTAFPFTFATNHTQDIAIKLASETFHFGERLDYTVVVSDVTGEDAKIFITNTMGVRSPLVTVPIYHEETRVIAPIGFDSIIWDEGTYLLELEYSGAKSKIEFTIVDDGSIGIPYWVKDLAKLWLTTQMPDNEYAKAIQYLIEQKLIENSEPSDTLYIPQWFRYPTAWWADGQIDDSSYANAIQFLLNEKFMVIPFDQESSDASSVNSL